VISVAADTALADVGRALGERSDQRENRRARFPDATPRAAPFEREGVGAGVVGVGAAQPESRVALTPGFYVGPKMELGLFGHPGGFAECRDQLRGAGYELSGVAHAVPAVVVVPAFRHGRTVHETELDD
jgi:hypothetical protein